MRYTLAGAALLAVACGDLEHRGLAHRSDSSDAIIQGDDCGIERFPSAVAILIDATISSSFGNQHIQTVGCTGTLIAPDVVLTAAHCVDLEALTFGFGSVSGERYFVTWESNLNDLAMQVSTQFPEDAVEAVQWVKHPAFDLQSMQNVNGPGRFEDIALIFLEDAVEHVEPAVVVTAQEAQQLAEQAPVSIAGWGQQTTASFWEEPPPNSVGIKQCGESWINEMGDFEMQVGETATRKCHGDSGGPTYWDVDGDASNRRVVGVTSHAYDEEDCLKGGVDTLVPSYLAWIDETMTQGCTSGTRAWCDVAGIISPELPNQGSQGPSGNGTIDAPTRRGSGQDDDGCAATNSGFSVWAVVGLWLIARRRRV